MLLDVLEISPEQARHEGIDNQPEFPLKVPWSYLSRINKGQVNNPLLRQILALDNERSSVSGETDDPVEDL